MRDNIYKRVTEEAWASKDHLERIMILIFCYARGGVTEPFVARYGMDYAGIIEALDLEIEQAKMAINTAEALVIAKEILRRIEEMIEEMEKEEDSDDEMERILIPARVEILEKVSRSKMKRTSPSVEESLMTRARKSSKN